jgi:hypothetical protein
MSTTTPEPAIVNRPSRSMARRKPENMIEAADIQKSETVVTAEAKGHSLK